MSEISKCERCREYNAAAVDFRHMATSALNDYAALRARHNALREAVKKYIAVIDETDWAVINNRPISKKTLSQTVTARAEVDRLLEEGEG